MCTHNQEADKRCTRSKSNSDDMEMEKEEEKRKESARAMLTLCHYRNASSSAHGSRHATVCVLLSQDDWNRRLHSVSAPFKAYSCRQINKKLEHNDTRIQVRAMPINFHSMKALLCLCGAKDAKVDAGGGYPVLYWLHVAPCFYLDFGKKHRKNGEHCVWVAVDCSAFNLELANI